MGHHGKNDWTHNASALWISILYNHTGMVQNLLRHGANVELGKKRKTPLLLAIDLDKVNMVRILIAHGAAMENLNLPGGHNALFSAVRLHRLDIIQVLVVQGGVNINKLDDLGMTPLIYATKGEDENVVALLLMLGCDKHIQEPGGMTAEEIASGDVLRVIKSYA